MTNHLRRYKASICIQIVIVTIGWLTVGQSPESHQEVINHLGMSWEILTEGRLWHLVTGTWIQSRPGLGWEMVSMCVMVGLGTFPLEHRLGSRVLLLTVIPADWFATVMTSVTLRMLVAFGYTADRALLVTADSGTSALAWGGMAAGAVVMPRPWRRILVPLVVLAVCSQFLIESPAPAIAHGWAVLFGLVLGHWQATRHSLYER